MTATVTVPLTCPRCNARHVVTCEQTARPRTAIVSCVRCNRAHVLPVPARRSDPAVEPVDVTALDREARLEKGRRQAALNEARYGGSW